MRRVPVCGRKRGSNSCREVARLFCRGVGGALRCVHVACRTRPPCSISRCGLALARRTARRSRERRRRRTRSDRRLATRAPRTRPRDARANERPRAAVAPARQTPRRSAPHGAACAPRGCRGERVARGVGVRSCVRALAASCRRLRLLENCGPPAWPVARARSTAALQRERRHPPSARCARICAGEKDWRTAGFCGAAVLAL